MDKGENKEAPDNPGRLQGGVHVHSFNNHYTEVAGYLKDPIVDAEEFPVLWRK